MHSIRLAFLGQCFVFGYRGVPRHQTYPEIVKPPAFNPDESDRLYASNAPDVYRLANAVVRRLAATHGVLLVDRMAVVDGCRRSVFLNGHLRLSSLGHEMLGHTLAEALLRSGFI